MKNENRTFRIKDTHTGEEVEYLVVDSPENASFHEHRVYMGAPIVKQYQKEPE